MAAQTRPQLHAQPRQKSGRKSELRTMRRNGEIPASLFGHGDPENIRVSARELGDYLRHHTSGAMLELVVGKTKTPALIREMDRNPITGEVITLGFQRIDLREAIKASVPIIVTGEDALIAEGLVLARSMDQLEVHCRADALPEGITVDVSACTAGTTIRISDLQLPEGVETTKDAELPVLTVNEPHISADVAAALDAEEAAHEAEKAAHEEEAAETAAEPEEGEAEPSASE